ncbi:hypothetical protein [Metallosphaera javensis (ex Sakai et al. 2022)]|uniref:hypothetical protein n=1 Tax=Metallosphaera javensis (ex Sakai et al. 2022) TaxID=2775498 RepID=UPI00258E2FDB|nr:MAG: hypothetical protein MjAS7_2905 [Metallosphaera javensis (ex Sakai et al. 2022)]
MRKNGIEMKDPKLHFIITAQENVRSSEVEPSLQIGNYLVFIFMENFAIKTSQGYIESTIIPLNIIIRKIVNTSLRCQTYPILLKESPFSDIIYFVSNEKLKQIMPKKDPFRFMKYM